MKNVLPAMLFSVFPWNKLSSDDFFGHLWEIENFSLHGHEVNLTL